MIVVDRIPIFSTDIFKIKLSNHNKIKKYLMDNVYPGFLKDGPNDPVQNVYTDSSVFKQSSIKVPWKMLSKFYEDDVWEVLKTIGVTKDDWSLDLGCWYGFTTESLSEFVHDHSGGPNNYQFGAVHYVTLDTESSGTVFVDPCSKQIKSALPTNSPSLCPDYFAPTKRAPAVQEGDFIMFPAWLDHHVPKHTNGTLRVVVVMNIMIRTI
jgi:hypothetical protein